MFINREHAGELLAQKLANFRNNPDAVVLAIPRGGLVTGGVISRVLNIPLDVVLAKKIGHPRSSEYAIGAVDLAGYSVDDQIVERDEIPDAYIQKEVAKVQLLLRKRYQDYRGERAPIALAGKFVILTDDGVATGSTMFAAIACARREQAQRVIVAVPVAPPDTASELRRLADKVITLIEPEGFMAIGRYYENFDQISDKDAVEIFRAIPGGVL